MHQIFTLFPLHSPNNKAACHARMYPIFWMSKTEELSYAQIMIIDLELTSPLVRSLGSYYKTCRGGGIRIISKAEKGAALWQIVTLLLQDLWEICSKPWSQLKL